MAFDPATTLQNTIAYLTSREFLEPAGKVIVMLKTFAVMASLLLLANIILLGIRMKFYRNFYIYAMKGSSTVAIPEGKLKKRWKKIKSNVQSNDPASYKLAIIEADKIVDHILEIGGFRGKTVEERLANVNDGQIKNIQELIRVHRMKQEIIQDPTFIMSADEAREAVEIYAQALKDLDTDIAS